MQIEYVPAPSIAVDSAGSPCICFVACTIHAIVTDPPRGINSGIDIDLRVLGATFAVSSGAPSVQVHELLVYAEYYALCLRMFVFLICDLVKFGALSS